MGLKKLKLRSLNTVIVWLGEMMCQVCFMVMKVHLAILLKSFIVHLCNNIVIMNLVIRQQNYEMKIGTGEYTKIHVDELIEFIQNYRYGRDEKVTV